MVSMDKRTDFTLRLSPKLKGALEAEAKEKELSLTAYIRMQLAERGDLKAQVKNAYNEGYQQGFEDGQGFKDTPLKGDVNART